MTLANADATELLLVPIVPRATPWPRGRYRLTITYFPDTGDERGPGPRRYDHPVRRRLGSPYPETAYLHRDAAAGS